MVVNIQNPRISVLMPVYNAEPFLLNAIESILNQSFSNFELLISDDGSTDNSWNILCQINDKRVTVYRNETNQGVLLTTNKLFELCQGDLITFQDADDWSQKNRLELQEKAFRNDAALRLCGTQCTYIRGKKLWQSSYPLKYSELINALENNESSICCGASVMFQSTLLGKYGGYRLFFNRIGAEHLDFFWRMIAQEKFINLSLSLYNYRSNPNSFSQSIHNNPLKFYSTKLALLAYWQRKSAGTDFLDNKEESEALTESLCKAHSQDPSLTSSNVALTQLAFGNIKNFTTILKVSFRSYGLTSANLRASIMAIPLFILNTVMPNSLKRFLIRKSNQRFLAKHGVEPRYNSQ